VANPHALPVLTATARAICERVADQLEAEADDLAETMTAAVFAEIPAFGAIATSDQRTSVLTHSVDHVRAIVLAVRTWTLPVADDLRFVNARGRLRAGQRVPLSALLHSYRVGHRTVWERLVRVLGGLDTDLNAALALTTLARTDETMRRMLSDVRRELPKPVEPAVLAAEIARLTGRERRRAHRA